MWITTGPVENVVSTQSRSFRKSRLSRLWNDVRTDYASLAVSCGACGQEMPNQGHASLIRLFRRCTTMYVAATHKTAGKTTSAYLAIRNHGSNVLENLGDLSKQSVAMTKTQRSDFLPVASSIASTPAHAAATARPIPISIPNTMALSGLSLYT